MKLLQPQLKDQILYQNLEEFQEFENDMAGARRLVKSAAAGRESLSSKSQRRIKSRQIRAGQRKVTLQAEASPKNDKRTEKDREKASAEQTLAAVVNEACEELVINKEQVVS